MTVPRISVVTPSFRQAVYLPDCLDSVRGQSVAHEHLVVDGGSADGTLDVLAARDDVRWTSAPDRGQSDALNKGFERCEGEVIGWLNADDFYLEGAFEKVMAVFDADPAVEVVYGDCLFVDAGGCVVRAKCEHGFDAPTLRHYGAYMPSTATFFRRGLRDRGLLTLDESCRYVMDLDLFMRLGAAGVAFGYVPDVLAAFRWHDSNQSLDDVGRIAERHRVQRALDRRPRPDWVYDLLHAAYRVRHVWLKALSGGLARQQAWMARRGEDVRWWSGS